MWKLTVHVYKRHRKGLQQGLDQKSVVWQDVRFFSLHILERAKKYVQKRICEQRGCHMGVHISVYIPMSLVILACR